MVEQPLCAVCQRTWHRPAFFCRAPKLLITVHPNGFVSAPGRRVAIEAAQPDTTAEHDEYGSHRVLVEAARIARKAELRASREAARWAKLEAAAPTLDFTYIINAGQLERA
jgi:hypothetical protein